MAKSKELGHHGNWPTIHLIYHDVFACNILVFRLSRSSLPSLGESTLFFDLPLWLIRFLFILPVEALFLGLATYFFFRFLQSQSHPSYRFIFIAISLFLLALLALGVVGDVTAITAYYPQIRFALVLWFQYTLAYLFLPKPHM